MNTPTPLRFARASAVLFACASIAAQGNAPPRIVSGAVAFQKQVVDNAVDQTHAVAAGDFDGNGWLDLVATDLVDGEVYWYANDGRGNFSRRVLDAALPGAYPVSVADVDGDGDADVLAGGYAADLFTWYESDRAGNFTRHVVGSADGPHSIVAADVDRDGDVDLLTSSQDDGIVAWYENDGAQRFTRRVIDGSATGAKHAEAADLDGDGDVDIVAASYFANEVAWHENDGRQSFAKHVVDGTATGAYYATPADVNGDGRIDILATAEVDFSILWYESLGAGAFRTHRIDTEAAGARSVLAADLDGDGDLDPIGTSVGRNFIAWYANLGRRGPQKRSVDFDAPGAYGISVVDIDRDGDLDVLSASRDADTIAVHRGFRRQVATVDPAGARTIDGTVLLAVDDRDAPRGLVYTLTRTPTAGRLELFGLPLSLDAKFSQDDVDQRRVRYVHGGSATTFDSFAFVLRDGNGTGVPVAGDFEIAVVRPGDSVVHLPFDEGSGTLARDVSGNGNDGRLLNGAAFEANTRDRSPSAVRFDGVDDVVDLGAVDVRGPGLTLAIWMNADSFPGPFQDPRLFSKTSGTGSTDYVFLLSPVDVGGTTRIRGIIRIGGVLNFLNASMGDLRAGTWYHVALTHDGAWLRLYLDGLEVGSAAMSGALDVAPSVPIGIGGEPAAIGGANFHGLLDDARILQRALLPSEIVALAAGCRGDFTPYGAGLAGSGGFVPSIDGTGCPTLRQPVVIRLANGLGGAIAGIVFGTRKSSQPLLGGTLLVEPLVLDVVALGGAGAGRGTGSYAVAIPADGHLVGRSFYWQAAVLDSGAPQGVSFTSGLDMSMGF